MTLREAIAAGYRCTEPDRKPAKLESLCKELGPDYHLATMNYIPGVGKDVVIHRVIGDGYDIEIYGPVKGKYHVALWEEYGTHMVMELADVPEGNVGDRALELVCTYVPTDVVRKFFGEE